MHQSFNLCSFTRCVIPYFLLLCWRHVSVPSCRPVLAPNPVMAPTHVVYLLFFFFGQFPLLGFIVYFHNLFNWRSSVSWPWRVSSNLRLLLSPFPSSLLAKNFAAGCFRNVMRTAHTFVSRILDRLHLPEKTSGFPTSPPPTVPYCFRGCNYIFLHAAAKAGRLVSDFPVSSPLTDAVSSFSNLSASISVTGVAVAASELPRRASRAGGRRLGAPPVAVVWAALNCTEAYFGFLQLTSTGWFFYHQPAVGSDYMKPVLSYLLGSVSIT